MMTAQTFGTYYEYPSQDLWKEITQRPHKDATALYQSVRKILDEVKADGDEAIKRLEQKFDGVCLDSLKVSEEEFHEAEDLVENDLKAALHLAYQNIRKFHESQRTVHQKIETAKGVTCWRRDVPIQSVGLYVPGGTAPLFSTVLMLATPAQIAGCQHISLCSPPNREGKLHPAILYAAKLAGVSNVFKIGGVQAVAAMAYGTKSVPRAYKIFGPGNQYVMAAKQLVSVEGMAIDMPAGPSEVAVIADETSNAAFVAADLLSQAEHGMDSQVLLISTDRSKMDEIQYELANQLERLPRKEMASSSLSHSKFVLVHDLDEAFQICNEYAPEHLILPLRNAEAEAAKVVNAGSVFLGPYSCESAGDYASGTNHTLPTSGFAKAYSGVSLDSFLRKITFQELSPEGIRSIGPSVEIMAEQEQLFAHKNAMTLRINEIERTNQS